MINLLANFPLDTVNTFFIFGVISGVLYYCTSALLSRVSALLSRDGANTLLKGCYKDLSVFFKERKALTINNKLRDLIRAIFMLIVGFFLVLLNFVFTNGTLRIYLIIFFLVGLYSSKIIIGTKIFSVAIDLVFRFFALFLFVLFYPTRFFYRILTKKRMQNYSTPPI